MRLHEKEDRRQEAIRFEISVARGAYDASSGGLTVFGLTLYFQVLFAHLIVFPFCCTCHLFDMQGPLVRSSRIGAMGSTDTCMPCWLFVSVTFSAVSPTRLVHFLDIIFLEESLPVQT